MYTRPDTLQTMESYSPQTSSQRFLLSRYPSESVEIIGDGVHGTNANCMVRVINFVSEAMANSLIHYALSRPPCNVLVVNGAVSEKTFEKILEYCEINKVERLDLSNMACTEMSQQDVARSCLWANDKTLRDFATHSRPNTDSGLHTAVVVLSDAIEHGTALERLEIVTATPQVLASTPPDSPGYAHVSAAATIAMVRTAMSHMSSLYSVVGDFVSAVEDVGAWRHNEPSWISRNRTVV